VQQIVNEGVDLELNTWVDDIPGLLDDGYDSVLLATGAHKAYKINIPNADHPDNWLSLDLLKKACLGEEMDLSGRKIIVLGGGDVAMDAARVAVRLSNPEVKVVCRGMRAAEHEIREAEEEDIEIIRGRVFQRVILEDDKIAGVECLKADIGEVIDGKRQFTKLPGTEHTIDGDLVIWALGQEPDTSFLPDDVDWIDEDSYEMKTNQEMMTAMEGVFSAGDLRVGATTFVVDAIAEGHHAARCIDRYLRGEEGVPEPLEMPVATLSADEIDRKMQSDTISDAHRTSMGTIPPQERVNNFREVQVGLTEEEARHEAKRCLQCGLCAECLECVAACDREAINHNMLPIFEKFSVGTIILATGFQDFNPEVAPEYGYGRLDNVITAMEFERMINTMGPTNGEIRLKNGKKPESVAIIHCVGSRDQKYHEYCSRACCMYSLKISQLVRDYVGADVHEIYRDMRTYGKDYEEFYNRTKAKDVHFYHGLVREVTQNNGRLKVSWDESFYDQPDHIEADMIILATGFEPQQDAPEIAKKFGISLDPNGFFREKHPKLAPVETSSEGIFLAGACQFPKDIPDSVAQAEGAAAVALSMLDQGTIALSPSVAQVSVNQCAGCGQCESSCPYDAITIVDGVSEINIYKCKGCGTCVAGCPNKALTLIHYNDEQLIAEIRGALS
jgi:heterodisulfide reductase subunit A